MPDVVIVGAGVMGCTAALRLADAGARVTVLERSVPGAEASSAAGGILAPAAEAHGDGPALRLGVWSREAHERLAERLLADHGVDVGFRRWGVAMVALDDAEGRDLEARRGRLAGAGVAASLVDGDEARRLEPSLSPETRAALVLDAEAQLEPPALLRGLALAAAAGGVEFRTGATVRRVVVEGDRARGVDVGDAHLAADHVVVAAGSWTTLVPGVALVPRAVEPVRGQMVATETRPPLFRRVIFGGGGYVVTRPDGRVLVGSTMERVGFRREVTFAGLEAILARARRLAPRLADAPVRGHWSSFRPGTPDALPLVGSAGPAGLWIASGHFRNGILLGPVTAELVAHGVTGGALDPGIAPADAAALDPRRLAGGAP